MASKMYLRWARILLFAKYQGPCKAICFEIIFSNFFPFFVINSETKCSCGLFDNFIEHLKSSTNI